MKKYAVAILSMFENKNEIFFVEETSEVLAVKQALVDFCKLDENKEDQKQWNESLPNDLEELIDQLVDGDLAVAVKEII